MDGMTLAAEMSDGWVRPHDTYGDGISTTDHVRAVIESEGDMAEDWREPADAEAFREALAAAVVSGVGRPFADRGAAVITFGDGSRLTFHAWADGTASGYWWEGYGPTYLPPHVRDEIAAEAGERLAYAEEAVAVVIATGVAGFQDTDSVRASIRDAAVEYVHAWADAEAYGALQTDTAVHALAATFDVIGDAVAEGLRRRSA
jgi:hypothetical protein